MSLKYDGKGNIIGGSGPVHSGQVWAACSSPARLGGGGGGGYDQTYKATATPDGIEIRRNSGGESSASSQGGPGAVVRDEDGKVWLITSGHPAERDRGGARGIAIPLPCSEVELPAWAKQIEDDARDAALWRDHVGSGGGEGALSLHAPLAIERMIRIIRDEHGWTREDLLAFLNDPDRWDGDTAESTTL